MKASHSPNYNSPTGVVLFIHCLLDPPLESAVGGERYKRTLSMTFMIPMPKVNEDEL